MKRTPRSSRPLLAIAALLALGAVAAWAAPAARAATLRTGSPNPALTQYQRALQAGTSDPGLAPVPIERQIWRHAAVPLGPLAAMPAFFDLREVNVDGVDKLSPVRDQNPYGNCWAFAALGSLESFLRPGQLFDLSEGNLAAAAGNDFDLGFGNGGNYDMATAELTRWNGPVDEASDAYDATFVSGLAPLQHVQDVRYLPDLPDPASRTLSDLDTIKAAIYGDGTNGAGVFTGMYADHGMQYSSDSQYYSKTNHAFYYTGAEGQNHAVDIVGWDDDYPSSSFRSPPPGNGAFIVRNSWGSWGESGYFHVSYYDTRIGKCMAVFTSEATSDYGRNLGYDPYGFTAVRGFGDDTAWMAARFTSTGDAPLQAVSIYAQSPNTTYDVYWGSSRASRNLLASGTCTTAGYATIPFDTPPQLQAGVPFYVIVRLTVPNSGGLPLPVEWAYPGYSTKARSAAGQSYISADGSDWIDIGGYADADVRSDVCLRAFTGTPAPDDTPPSARALAKATVLKGRYVTLRYRVDDTTPATEQVYVTLDIKNGAGKVVKTLTPGWRKPNTALGKRFRCTLPRGTYRFCVYAKDLAGNAQSHIGSARLVVK